MDAELDIIETILAIDGRTPRGAPMSTALDAVADEAMKLSSEDRERLIDQLLASLPAASALHPDWEDEIARRLDDSDGGRTKLLPADEALSLLASHIQRRRASA